MCGRRCRGLALLLALGVVLMISGVAQPGELAPSLERRLATMQGDEYISAIVMMAEHAEIEELDFQLKCERATRQERHERVITALKEKAAATQGDFLRSLELAKREGTVIGYTPYWIANLVVVKATKEMVGEIASRSDIGTVYLNFAVDLIKPVSDERYGVGYDGIGVTPGLKAIRADEVWYDFGITGEGRLVANLDTGVDGNHPALNTRWRGYQGQHPWWECWMDALGSTQFPSDGYGHGTHVMGTMTGRADATGDTIGVGHHALWIANNAINQGAGPEFDNDVIEAYQWFADPDGNPQTVDDVPDVVQNSWRINENFSSVPPYTDCDDRWWDVIDNAEAAGVVTTWSAGNEGPGEHTIGSPADRADTPFNCFSVGAVDVTNNWPGSPPWPIANWSSRGPSGCPTPYTTKPEVVAPGVDVYSSVPGGGYEQWGWSGTSMAGPHAAGIVALMREANPDIEVDDVKNIMMETAIDHGTPGDDNTFGHGFVDAYEAVLMATVGYATLEGHVYAADNLDPLPAHLFILATTRQTDADTTGYYDFYVPGDSTYTVEASYFGFETQQQSVYVPPEQTTTLDFLLDRTPTGELAGLVTDLAGDPIEGALLEILDTPIPGTATGPSGMYLFPDVPGGATYEVSVSAYGYASRTKEVYITAEMTNILSFQLMDCFMDNMEQGAPDWTHEVITPGYFDEWHLSTQRNYTPGGAVSWKCGDEGPGNYADSLDAALLSPEVELPQLPLLTFYHWIDAEISSAYPDSAYDGGLVEISTDGGFTWTQITPFGGYPYTIRGGSNNPFPGGTPVFSGQFDWSQEIFDLSAYAGETAQLRFRFGSDWAVNDEGWYIDDVLICRTRTVSVTIVPDEAYVPQGGTLGLTATIVNHTDEYQIFFGLCDVFLPNGAPFAGNPVAGPTLVQLAPQQTRSVHLAHHVPAAAPTGLYTYRTRIGNPPNDLIDVDALGFVVTE